MHGSAGHDLRVEVGRTDRGREVHFRQPYPWQIEAAAGTFNAIHFTIDSKGGDSAESFEIASMLRSQVCPVAATAIGECCSGGLIIFMAAGLRKAKAGTEFQIHPTSRSADQLQEVRLTAAVLQKHAGV